MKVYATCNQKGGTGKSTTAVNLSAALAGKDVRTLLIDLDPQGDTSRWLDRYGSNHGLYKALASGAELIDAVENTEYDGLDIIPASDQMIKAPGELSGRDTLDDQLAGLPERWDTILIDCPPSLDDLSILALIAADGLIVPVQCRSIALNGLGRLLKTVRTVRENVNPELEISGVVANQVDGRARHSGDVLDTLRERFNGRLYSSKIRENIKVAEAPSFKEPVTSYAPNSRGAKDFTNLANEFIDCELTEVKQ